MKKNKKIGFFKRLKMSLFELENYIQFTSEKFSKALFFMIEMTILFTLILIISNLSYIYIKYQNPTNYINTIVPDFSYNQKELIIAENEDTEENKQIISIMKTLTESYSDYLPDGEYSKQDLINYVSTNEQSLTIMFCTVMFFEYGFDMFIFWLAIAIMTALIGLIVLTFSRIKMKFSKLYALSIYASTLSMILTVIYTILNSFFGVYIEFFDYLSMLIAYIYITAVIYMIRSDLVKQQLELIQIATVQAKVKEQLKKEEDEKEKEKEKKEPEDENKEKKPDEKKEDENLNDEPDGSEI